LSLQQVGIDGRESDRFSGNAECHRPISRSGWRERLSDDVALIVVGVVSGHITHSQYFSTLFALPSRQNIPSKPSPTRKTCTRRPTDIQATHRKMNQDAPQTRDGTRLGCLCRAVTQWFNSLGCWQGRLSVNFWLFGRSSSPTPPPPPPPPRPTPSESVADPVNLTTAHQNNNPSEQGIFPGFRGI
jgi:hypothetical protein